MLDLNNQQWFFNDMPRNKFAFAEHINDQSQHPVDNLDVNLRILREEEGRRLNPKQKDELVGVLKKYASVFEPGGEPTPYIKHHINTRNNPPVSVPPYRLSSVKKELLKKKLDTLLKENIIE
ncbi:hypothetical protein AVEN_90053-1 [Araneus ventricosus]|uniref:Reverse transcriptase domain-containing protein n=1 Tax=Araneus ventricosus TaxID=182803 RepID=A0A4Y2R397_ARAVE|nr:hypothetical protein AVEN_90053-1 [Araneus ventricosus]